MSAMSEFLLWLEEHYPEAHAESPIDTKYCEEFLAERTNNREYQQEDT